MATAEATRKYLRGQFGLASTEDLMDALKKLAPLDVQFLMDPYRKEEEQARADHPSSSARGNADWT